MPLRPAVLADNALLAELGVRTFRDTFGPDNTPEDMAAYLASAFSPEIQARELADPNGRYLILESDGAREPVGYVHLRFGPPPLRGASRSLLDAARPHGDAARPHGDAARSHGDAARSHGGAARPLRGAARSHGDAARPHGGAARPDLRPATLAGGLAMEISRIYVVKERMGQGLGATLMRACLDEATQAGASMVWLGVWERNPRAIAFYQRWGFEQVGTQSFMLGSDPQTDWIMARRP